MSKNENGISDRVNGILIPCLDVFGGTDGGLSFFKLRGLLEEMERRSVAGDVEADQVLVECERFIKFIEISSRT